MGDGAQGTPAPFPLGTAPSPSHLQSALAKSPEKPQGPSLPAPDPSFPVQQTPPSCCLLQGCKTPWQFTPQPALGSPRGSAARPASPQLGSPPLLSRAPSNGIFWQQPCSIPCSQSRHHPAPSAEQIFTQLRKSAFVSKENQKEANVSQQRMVHFLFVCCRKKSHRPQVTAQFHLQNPQTGAHRGTRETQGRGKALPLPGLHSQLSGYLTLTSIF